MKRRALRALGITLFALVPLTAAGELALEDYVGADQLIELAYSAEVQSSEPKGPFQCQQIVTGDSASFGATVEEAILRVQLKCIRQRCDNFMNLARSSQNELSLLTDSQLRDIYESFGFSGKELEDQIQAVRSPLPSQNITCREMTPNIRLFGVVDICRSYPPECMRESR